MIVKELMEKLSHMPADAKVWFYREPEEAPLHEVRGVEDKGQMRFTGDPEHLVPTVYIV